MFSNANNASPPDDLLSRVTLSGLNHRSVDLALRERFSINAERASEALEQVLKLPHVEEAVVLSTCNRVEVVAAHDLPCREWRQVEGVFEDVSGVSRSTFADRMYHYAGGEAIRHVFRVASGLDSMVLGEPQVLGQLKDAFHTAQQTGAAKRILSRLFHRAFGTAKEVRTKTHLSRRAVSICSAARELALQLFGDLSNRRVLIIGCGEMGTLALKHFQAAGVERIFVANRSYDRAVAVAENHGVLPIRFDLLPSYLAEVDIVVGTASREVDGPFFVTNEQVKQLALAHPGKLQLFVDLGVPRNFDAQINEISDAFVYNIDDFEAVVERNRSARMLEAERAELIVEDGVLKFSRWLQQHQVAPVIQDVVLRYDSFRATEIARTMRRLRQGSFSDAQLQIFERALEDHSRALLSKALHRPLTTLKKRAVSDDVIVEQFKDLFGETESAPAPVVRLRGNSKD